MKIVFLDSKTLGEVSNLDQINTLGDVAFYESTPPDKTIERIRDAGVVITNKVVIDSAAMEQAPQLKLICIAATGTNNIDLEYARNNGIIVKNAVDYSSNSVAQFTFNSLFYLLHQSRYYDDYVKSKSYCQNDTFTHIGREFWELSGKKFGIIGLGSIGQKVAQIAQCFGAEVIYYSTSGRNTDQPYRQVSMEELLQLSDVISIHAPLNAQTKDLMRYKEIKQMKPGAYLVNVGRGGIINERDLVQALNENLIAGCATDVMTQEPIPPDHPFFDVKNPEKIFITPHVAWASIEARVKLVDIVCDHIREFQQGQ